MDNSSSERNIKLAYLLAAMKNSWFWLGIWIFYYLKFTNYTGIGILETITISTTTLAEIPTGAVADLLGKRKTLILAFLFEGIGTLIIATAPSFAFLGLSIFIMCLGGALYSGTLDALVFDSLKERGKESLYDKVISKISAIAWAIPAVCGVIGGFLYVISPRLPFVANGITYCIGFGLSFFLTEPSIDTDKFTYKNFISQTKQGLSQLIKTVEVKRQTMLLLSIGFFVVIADELINAFLGVEFGFNAKQLGILMAVIYLISAAATQLTPFLRRKTGDRYSLFIVGGLIAVSLIISPVIGIILGGAAIAIRSSLQAIFGNLASVAINNSTESKYRATTISTFNMIKNIPYVASAWFIGSLSDTFSAKYTALILGLILAAILFWQFVSGKSLGQRKTLQVADQ